MKRNATKSLLLIPLFFLIILVNMGYTRLEDGSSSFKTEEFIEAELGKINGPIAKFSGSNASADNYLMNHYTTSNRLQDPALQELPDISYNIEIPADGDYFIWMRVKVPAFQNMFGNYLSLYIGSDNLYYNACILKRNNDWEWQRVTNLRLKKGIHSIDFKHKDFHLGIDKIFITSTGSDLTGLGANPSREEILKNNFNSPISITYPIPSENEGVGLDFPRPPLEHPRLFLRERDITALKEKTNNPLMKTAWDKIVVSSKVNTDELLDAPVDGMANFSMETIYSIESNALMYVLYKDKDLGRNAIDAMLNFFNTVKFNPSTSDISRIYGRFILSAAIVYDWCYDLLDDTEKKSLISWAETMASKLELGWPIIKQGAVTGHGSEYQLMRDMLSAGIAMYDENKNIYEFAAGRFFKHFVPARTFFYPGGYHHQGSSYGGYRFTTELYATALFDKMGYPAIFGDDQKKVPYYAIYNRRPDGQIMRNGDDYTSGRTNEYWTVYGQSDLLCASLFKDPIVMGEAIREMNGFGKTNDYLFDFLLVDPSVKPEPLDKLPLTKYFPSPLGAMVARTGWELGKNSPTVVASMKIGEYQFLNHQHLDAGQFQLYYKGALATEGGHYDAYGTDHDYNYYKRTISHNTLLIYDPNEKTLRNRVNDGGQYFPNNGSEAPTIDVIKKDHKVATILAHKYGPDSIKPEFSYLKGDITHAYTNKVSQVKRTFVFLNLKEEIHPAALIVFDKVISSNENFKKTWLLHSIEEPVIDGNKTEIIRSKKGYNGKMVNTTLWPAPDDLQISKIGGEGREFEVNGVNYPVINKLPNPETTHNEAGSWRIEVSPKKPAKENYFMNIMQVMENGINELPVKKIDEKSVVGAQIADRVVLFSKNSELLKSPIQFSIKDDKQFKILLTDLAHGKWKVLKDKKVILSDIYVKEDGTLYIDGNKGDYVVTK